LGPIYGNGGNLIVPDCDALYRIMPLVWNEDRIRRYSCVDSWHRYRALTAIAESGS